MLLQAKERELAQALAEAQQILKQQVSCVCVGATGWVGMWGGRVRGSK